MTGASPAAARAADRRARSAAWSLELLAAGFFATLFFEEAFLAVALPCFFTAGRVAPFGVDDVLEATFCEANGRTVTERHGVHDEDQQSRREAVRRIQTSTRLPPRASLLQGSG